MFADTLLAGFRRRRKLKSDAAELYRALLRQTRQPGFYSALGVPDSFDGRFDVLVLHAYLLFRRLRQEKAAGPALSQAVFDVMFADMDAVLREQGVGDLSVGKKIRAMAEAFYGRVKAYDEAFDADGPALCTALARNVYAGAVADQAAAPLAAYARAADVALAQADFAAPGGANLNFPPIPAPPVSLAS
jgi:cytochrome b pre-mRNA-processing protein 3